MAPQEIDQSQPSVLLPPLLALPLELKLQILANFSHDDSSDIASDPDHAITLMILRRTHKSLRRIIPNPWRQRRPTKDHVLTAEHLHPYLFPSECRYPEHACTPNFCSESYFFSFHCYGCKTFCGRHEVCNWKTAHLLLQDEESWDSMGGEHAQDRHCDECWEDLM